MKLSVLVVDDEAPARDELKYLLAKDEKFIVVGEANSGKSALELALKLRPDVIFLDIEMYDINGLEVAAEIFSTGLKPYIVFATAFDQYAVKAFEVNAVDYLLKPLKEERLSETLRRITSNYLENTNSMEEKINKILSTQQEKTKPPRIPVEDNGSIVLVKPQDIIYVEAKDRGAAIYTLKKQFQTSHSLGELEENLLKHNFIRTHRSFLVNEEYIKQIIPWFNNTFLIKLEGTIAEIPVSRTYIKYIKNLIQI